MTTRVAKLRRLDDFRRAVPYVSASALAAILKEAQTNMPELIDRDSIREARNMQVDEVTPYGPIMVTLQVEKVDGNLVDLMVINPFAQLWVAAKRCESFSRMLARSLAKKPSSYEEPWGFIIYTDELLPGNQMSFHNLRKCWVVYYSFMEFGPEILCDEEAWFCTSAERSERVKNIGGGIAQVFMAILKFIFAPGGHSLMTSGIYLELFDGRTVRVWAKLRMILQDGGAHKQVFMLKGDAGLKICTECRNLYTENSGIVDEENNHVLTCSMHLAEDMDFATDADVRGTVRRLAHVAATRPGELKLREVACGFNHNKFNLLLEPSLDNVVRPVDNMAHDWMHTFVVHGVWNTIMFLLLHCLQGAVGNAVQSIHDYVAMWVLPGRLGGSGARLADAFSAGRWKASVKAKYFKCTASDAMSLFCIVACYIHAVYLRAGVCVPECRAYIALCEVLDLLVVLALGVVTEEQFHKAVDDFLKACLEAGWRDSMHPKFHWCIHLVRELVRFGILLTCWVHERKHRMVKRYTNDHRNTRAYEASILSEVTCQHFYNLSLKRTFDLEVGLREPIAPCTPAMCDMLSRGLQIDDAECMTAKRARVSKFEVVQVSDVVIWKDRGHLSIGKIMLLASVDGIPLAVIALWPLARKDLQQGTVDVQINEHLLKFRPVGDIITACMYRKKGSEDIAQIIVPCLYRRSLGRS